MLGVKTLHIIGIPYEVQLNMTVCPGHVLIEGGTRVTAAIIIIIIYKYEH